LILEIVGGFSYKICMVLLTILSIYRYKTHLNFSHVFKINLGEANMAESIRRMSEVKNKTGLSRSTIYELIKRKQFPKPINLGLRSVGWLESEIEAWIQDRIASRSISKK
jgi:prophage regulatory protein